MPRSLLVACGLLLSLLVVDGADTTQTTCNVDLGVASGLLSSQNIKASSSFIPSAACKTSYAAYAPGDARLDQYIGFGGWAPQTSSPTEYWEVDLVKMVPVSSIVTQGFKARLHYNTSRYVTSYQVLLGNNTRSLTPVMSSDGIPRVFVANNDSTMAITNTLDAPVLASVIRLTNFTTAVGGKPGLRVSLLGCKEPSVFSDLRRCDSPLGVSSGQINNSMLTASTVWDFNYAAYYARLNRTLGKGGWCGNTPVQQREYFQVDLGKDYNVAAIGTQGIIDTGADGVSFYLLNYMIDIRSDNSTTWHGLTEIRYRKDVIRFQRFTGNNDANTVNKQYFILPLRARYIRLYNYSIEKLIDPCMRLEVYGCDVPPATVPPATVPPATVPPATVPPATVPPATVPPVTKANPMNKASPVTKKVSPVPVEKTVARTTKATSVKATQFLPLGNTVTTQLVGWNVIHSNSTERGISRTTKLVALGSGVAGGLLLLLLVCCLCCRSARRSRQKETETSSFEGCTDSTVHDIMARPSILYQPADGPATRASITSTRLPYPPQSPEEDRATLYTAMGGDSRCPSRAEDVGYYDMERFKSSIDKDVAGQQIYTQPQEDNDNDNDNDTLHVYTKYYPADDPPAYDTPRRVDYGNVGKVAEEQPEYIDLGEEEVDEIKRNSLALETLDSARELSAANPLALYTEADASGGGNDVLDEVKAVLDLEAEGLYECDYDDGTDL